MAADTVRQHREHPCHAQVYGSRAPCTRLIVRPACPITLRKLRMPCAAVAGGPSFSVARGIRPACTFVHLLLPSTRIDHWVRDFGSSRWLKHVMLVVRGAVRMQNLVMGGTPVLVHCSDGWDRTSQLSALAQLLLDPCVGKLSVPVSAWLLVCLCVCVSVWLSECV